MLDTTSSGSMDSSSENHVDGPIRSRFRGLSWDKKHQGWRVRIYWAGKQRHVGRYEDDVVAARAYDKSAYYLYGASAITNFGLEACLADRTEVSPFIVLAKEQAEQEQLGRARPLRVISPLLSLDMPMAKEQQLLQNSSVSAKLALLQQQHQQQLLQQQQQQSCSQLQQPIDAFAHAEPNKTVFKANVMPPQQQLLDGLVQMQQQQQQLFLLPQQAMSVDTSSNMSGITSATASPPVSRAATATSGHTSNASGYVLCTTPAGQQLLLQVSPNNDALRQQQHLQQQQQVAQQVMLVVPNSGQLVQLPRSPQLLANAGHISAVPLQQQQQQPWQPQMLDLMVSPPKSFTASSAECSLPMAPAAAQSAAAAAALTTATSMICHPLGAGTACSIPELSGILDSVQGYASCVAATTAAEQAAISSLTQQQQHAAALLYPTAGGSMFASECSSCSCSPVVAASYFS